MGAAMNRILPLLGAHAYIRLFRGKTFVIKVSGSILADERASAALAEDVALLHHVGIRVVLVHGGGPQLDALCARLEVPREVVAGRRVTDARTLELARMVFRGQLNSDLVTALSAQGVRAVGISGGDGMTVVGHRRAARTVRDPSTGTEQVVDFGFVGDIDRVDPKLPRLLLEADMVPVVCSLITAEDGGLLNTNADTIAARLAIALGAEKLVVCTSVPGLLEDRDDPRRLVSYGDVGTVEELIRQGVVSGGMLPKLAAVTEALRGGVPRVHIIDGTRPHSLLLEIFTNEGCGTMLVLQSDEG
jgi:acetylglutamate kinase